ncbi:MAG: LLM class flavin-dependent oxidoreductase [Bacillati bacterium ANGP1]|uniref:LLM class flavin-dependent oxidoreductase n=1 Tax=Candidatus Segetimicrobium genomatis TaxID=2569760 RepID=A0A537KS75_9BACT|nr:MAG: LLM class flavin-dependent oxidoreductase [Terrabacteria group bacterium ANGP1]
MHNRLGYASTDVGLEVFSTCPQSSDGDRETYLQRVVDVARWSERAGCKGILVYSDNRLADPWLISHIIIQNTVRLCPLVAVQPVYMHPYAVAKMVASFGHLHGRRIYLNMVAGGFKNDLVALNETTPHDKRYDRLIEYTLIIRELLAGPAAVSCEGEFYKVKNLRLTPPLRSELFPGIFVSGSSDAGLAAAKAIGATAVKYPKAPGEEVAPDEGVGAGVRVGIIAREDSDEAWRIARERFPEDRRGQLTHQLAMKVSDSVWHGQLSELAEATASGDSPYWLVPFENYKTMCPYLVGSYERVGEELSRYIAVGYRSFILDIPPTEEDLHHTNRAFHRAMTLVTR